MSQASVNILDAIDPRAAANAAQGATAMAGRAANQQLADQQVQQENLKSLLAIIESGAERKHQREMQAGQQSHEKEMAKNEQGFRSGERAASEQFAAQQAEIDRFNRQREADRQFEMNRAIQDIEMLGNDGLVDDGGTGSPSGRPPAAGGVLGGGLAPGDGVRLPGEPLPPGEFAGAKAWDRAAINKEVRSLAVDHSSRVAAAMMLSERAKALEAKFTAAAPPVDALEQSLMQDLSVAVGPAMTVERLQTAVSERASRAAESALRGGGDLAVNSNLGKSLGALVSEGPLAGSPSGAKTFGKSVTDLFQSPGERTAEGHSLAQAYYTAPFLRDWAEGMVRSDKETPKYDEVREQLANRLGDVLTDTVKLGQMNRGLSGAGPEGYKDGILKRIKENTKALEADGISQFEIQTALDSLGAAEGVKKAIDAVGSRRSDVGKLTPYVHEQLADLSETYRSVMGSPPVQRIQHLGTHLPVLAAAIHGGAQTPEQVAAWIDALPEQDSADRGIKNYMKERVRAHFGAPEVAKVRALKGELEKTREQVLEADTASREADIAAKAGMAGGRQEVLARIRKKIAERNAELRLKLAEIDNRQPPGTSPSGPR